MGRIHGRSTKCAGHRLNADECDTEILHALAGFYRNHHTLIADTITNAQREHRAGRDAQHAELSAVNAKITDTNTKIDRYLTAFENGTMDEQLIGDRLNQLRTTVRQLTAHRDQLTAALEDAPTGPDPADLTALAEHITTVISTGPEQARKALIETLITEIKITGPDTLRPLFRIPQPPTDTIQPTKEVLTSEKMPARASRKGVRPMANMVVRWCPAQLGGFHFLCYSYRACNTVRPVAGRGLRAGR